MKKFAILLSLLCLAGALAAEENAPAKVVRVTGTSEVKVVPDRAVIDVGVQKQDPNAGAAKRAADQVARRILATLKAQGIDERDVQTSYLSLRPESYRRKGVTISYFVAEETLSITVRDLSKLDALLEQLVKAGGNRIDSIGYETSDMRKYRDQARDLAVKAAREKAEALAKALGQEIGKARSIEEIADGSPYQIYNTLRSMGNAESEAVPTRAPGPSIAAGQKTISASVTVQFELN